MVSDCIIKHASSIGQRVSAEQQAQSFVVQLSRNNESHYPAQSWLRENTCEETTESKNFSGLSAGGQTWDHNQALTTGAQVSLQ